MREVAVARRVGALVALAVLAGGCFWSGPGANPNRQGHNGRENVISAATVSGLAEAWRAPTDGGPVGEPVTSQAGVHVSDGSAVYGFDRGGNRRWAVAASAPVRFSPEAYVGGTTLRIGGWNPTATEATDPSASDQTLQLDVGTGTEVQPPREGVLVAQRGRRTLYAAISHIRLGGWIGHSPFWVTNLQTDPAGCCPSFHGLVGGGTSAPPAPHGLTLGSRDIYEVKQGPSTYDDPLSPMVNAMRAYSVTASSACPNYTLYVCPRWTVPLDGAAGTRAVLSDDESLAYTGTDVGTVFAVDVAGRSVAWSTPVGAPVADSPALAGGSLYVATTGGGLVVLDAETGQQSWVAEAGSSVVAQPAVGGGVVFVASAGGALAAYDAAGCGAATCEPLWTASVGSEVTGGPIVEGGQVVVGTEDGHLVAYDLG